MYVRFQYIESSGDEDDNNNRLRKLKNYYVREQETIQKKKP